jgi:ribonuclease E
MRVLEDALIKSASHNVILRTRTDIALYILNQKRSLLRLIEERFGVAVTVEADDSLTGGAYHALERGEPAAGVSGDPMRRFDPRRPIDDIEPIGEAEAEIEFEEETEGETVDAEAVEVESGEEREADGAAEAESRRRRRRRRGRGRGYDRESSSVEANAEQPSDEGLGTLAAIGGDLVVAMPAPAGGDDDSEAMGDEESDGRRRGRGRWRRRGGRGGRGGETGEFNGDWRPSDETRQGVQDGGHDVAQELEGVTSGEAPGPADGASEAEPRRANGDEADFAPLPSWGAETSAPQDPRESAPEPEPVSHAAPEATQDSTPRQPEPAPAVLETQPEPPRPAPAPAPQQPELPVITQADPDKPKRSGWWARAKANLTGH